MRLKPEWCLWRWSEDGLTILRTPWFQVLFQWIEPDIRGSLHDHPWAFFGFIIDGCYTEVVGTPDEDLLINTHFNYVDFICRMNKTDAHCIVSGRAKALIFTGPTRKRRSWFTPVGKKAGEGDVLCMHSESSTT